MKNICNIRSNLKKPVVTLGTFDGVHLGHKKILAELVSRAKLIDGNSIVVTYHPHPIEILEERKYPYLLSEKELKQELLKNMGVDYVLWFDFDKEKANMEPEKFVQEYFVEKLRSKEIILGYDWHFGKERKGDYHLLKKMEDRYGFRVDMVKEKVINGEIVSSTKIRKYLKDGDVESANSMLGREYSISGEIVDVIDLNEKYYGYNFKKIENRKLLPKAGLYKIKVAGVNKELNAFMHIKNINQEDGKEIILYYDNDRKLQNINNFKYIKITENLDLEVNNLDNKMIYNLLHTQK